MPSKFSGTDSSLSTPCSCSFFRPATASSVSPKMTITRPIQVKMPSFLLASSVCSTSSGMALPSALVSPFGAMTGWREGG